MRPVRLIIADDHAILIDGLVNLLAAEFEILGTASNGRDLVEMEREKKPDLVVTDISMPELNGVDAARIIKKEQRSARVLILTMHADLHLVEDAFRAGATGYVLKTADSRELISAIHCVARGGHYISPPLAGDVISTVLMTGTQPTTTSKGLTLRQREVLQLIAEGKTMKVAAARLGISTRTAESHKYEIMRQLGVRTTADLIRYAVRSNLTGL